MPECPRGAGLGGARDPASQLIAAPTGRSLRLRDGSALRSLFTELWDCAACLRNAARKGHGSLVVPITPHFQPVREPLTTTLLRTGLIALAVGVFLAYRWGALARWPLASLLVLWFSLGGHWVEVWFLNWLRPRLSPARPVQVAARVATWLIGGTGLALGMMATTQLLHGPPSAPWYLGGPAFIGLELAVHRFLQLRGRPSFYDGRG